MGMFDSVFVPCSCSELVEFQSKAGECILATYKPDAVPPEIASDLDGTSEICPNCNRYVTLHLHTKPIPRVPMWAEISEE